MVSTGGALALIFEEGAGEAKLGLALTLLSDWVQTIEVVLAFLAFVFLVALFAAALEG